MDDYISREDVVHIIMGQPPDAHYPSWYAAQIEDIPAADVVPVVHGRWIKEYRAKGQVANMCTECGGETGRVSKYCPNCGAKMDGEEEES